jgi:chromosome segregation ATPase
MIQVAYIENRQLVVQEAQNRLEERRHQEQFAHDREKLDHSMADRIELLSSSRPDIVGSINRLKKCRANLMKEFNQVDQDLKAEEQKLANLPSTIAVMQEQRESVARQAQVLREQEQLIPGSADVDRQEIEVVDQLCLDCRAYSPGTHTRKDEDRLLLEFPCNPIRTRSV